MALGDILSYKVWLRQLNTGTLADGNDKVQEATQLRDDIIRSLQHRAEGVVKAVISMWPSVEAATVSEDRARLAGLILQLLTTALREGTVDSRSAAVAELQQPASDSGLGTRLLFSLVYLTERSTLNELALDVSLGAHSESWPAIAQIVRRSSFDVCAALSEHKSHEDRSSATIIDSLTTLYTKNTILAVVEKEVQRSGRFDHPFALILLDVDRLGAINATHGHSAGDRVLERIGIVVRSYFRETDWVARLAGGTLAVLLPETKPVDAERLAEGARVMIEERIRLHDHRSEQEFPVTVSVGLLIAESVDHSVGVEKILSKAKVALDCAKNKGGNHVERVDASVRWRSAPRRHGTPAG